MSFFTQHPTTPNEDQRQSYDMSCSTTPAPQSSEETSYASAWPTPESTEDSYPGTQHSSAWPHLAEPRGLGLHTQSGLYPSGNPATASLQVPVSWSTTYQSTLPSCTMADISRSGSVMDYSETSFTSLMQVSAPCYPVPTSVVSYMPGYETASSPHHSDYTYSSRPSMSSASPPYIRSHDEYDISSPPYIKVEDSMDYQNRARHSSLGSNAPILVNPNDLYGSPAYMPTPERPLPSNYGQLKSEMIDAKSMSHREYSHQASPRFLSDEEPEERQKRGYTTTDNATCHCHICHRPFQRSYNLKAHMDTHKPNREHPHACKWPGCGRRFVRNTDLCRHEKSVHKKCRDHVCHLCNQGFPRKDTLRRHTEDGCSRRPEVKKRLSRSRRTSTASPIARRVSPQALAVRL